MLNKYLVSILVLSLSSFSYGLKSDESQPIEIVANRATADQKNMLTVFSGDVVLRQGSIVVHANTAQAHQDQSNNRFIHLVGTPVTFLQLNDDGDKTEGQCNVFDYNTKENLAVLTGRARVKKGENLVMGDKLTYNTQTEIYSATSNNANGISSSKAGRVTVILQPKQKGANGTTATTPSTNVNF